MLVLLGSTLYGTTSNGGANGYGTIYKINTDGTGYSEIYASRDTVGYTYTLVMSDSVLYGIAGINLNNIIYKINIDGSGFRTLHRFLNWQEGYYPTGPLLISGNVIYGLTVQWG